MKAVVKTVDGQTLTLTGEVVNSVLDYFGKESIPHLSMPLGWVCAGNAAINFKHVVTIEFKKEDE